MEINWKKFKLDKNKVFQRIGQVVVWGSLYIVGMLFLYWMFLSGMTY